MKIRHWLAAIACSTSFGVFAAPVTFTAVGSATYGNVPVWQLGGGTSSFKLTAILDDATPASNANSDTTLYLPFQSAKIQFGTGTEFALALSGAGYLSITNNLDVGFALMDEVLVQLNFSVPNTSGSSVFIFVPRVYSSDSNTAAGALDSTALTDLGSVDLSDIEVSNSGAYAAVRAPIGSSGSYADFNFGDVTYTFTVAAVEPSVVPEPGSIALFGLALVGFAATRRKMN